VNAVQNQANQSRVLSNARNAGVPIKGKATIHPADEDEIEKMAKELQI
jgi:hypothetical protein